MPSWAGSDFVDSGRTVFKKMVGTSTAPRDAVYDSEFVVSPGGTSNHMLKLNLKMFLNKYMPPINPLTHDYFRTWVYADLNGNIFIIGPWNHAEWSRFVGEFTKQCNRWNNQFWLVPPAGFTALDIQVGGRKTRPNVYCDLTIQFVNSPAGAHRAITVVNLDAKAAAARAHQKESQVTSGNFRSSENTYDSMDTVPSNPGFRDPAGTPQKLRHYTITHEIGHAIGLPHIGVIRNEPLCQMAIVLKKIPGVNQSSLPALFQGSTNAAACYGDFSNAADSSNVMGGGDRFAPENAQPWLDQILRHTQTRTAWTVHMGHVPPVIVP